MNEKLKIDLEIHDQIRSAARRWIQDSGFVEPGEKIPLFTEREIAFYSGAEWMFERTQVLIDALEYIYETDRDTNDPIFGSIIYYRGIKAKEALNKFYGEDQK